MNPGSNAILLIGFGNPGRLDDGLGPALADAVGKLRLPGLTVEADYQLVVEDAAEIANHDIVIFADADLAGPEPFWVKRIQPDAARLGFSSHSLEPRALLALARQLFNAAPEAYILGIRGYAFNDFGENLSEKARANLAAAVAYVASAVRTKQFAEVRPEGADGIPPATATDSEAIPCKTQNA